MTEKDLGIDLLIDHRKEIFQTEVLKDQLHLLKDLDTRRAWSLGDIKVNTIVTNTIQESVALLSLDGWGLSATLHQRAITIHKSE